VIISIVGTDGSGKSTAAGVLARTLAASGTRVETLDKWDIYDFERHPECRFLQAPLPLLRRCISEMPGAARAMFIFWAIHISMSKARFDEGTAYVLDGYWMKHFATETLFGVSPGWIRATAAQLPEPDLTLFLRVAPEEAYRRKAAARDFVPYEFGLDPAMRESSFLAHQGRVLGVLDAWARDYGWATLDANRPAATVHAEILGLVRAHPRFPATREP
jgi:thymidylate kinase